MMIKTGLLSFLVLSTASSFAQSKTAVAGKIFYNMAHACDTTDLSLRYRREFVLFYGKDASLFQDYKLLVNSRNSRQELFAQKPGELYYTFPEKNELVKAREFHTLDGPPKNYVMPEPIAAVKWKISKETKQIAGFTCQKATGYCKGRNFTAWFCTDIPFRFGPWKLSGLPGLIMEAVDDTNELSFTFNRIENEPDNSFIQLPETYEITSEVVFENMRKTWSETVRAATAGIQVTEVDQSGKPVSPKPRRMLLYNKPMDLESKAPLVAYYLGN